MGFVFPYMVMGLRLVALRAAGAPLLTCNLFLVKSNRDRVRKAREAYPIQRSQTLEPHGLNI